MKRTVTVAGTTYHLKHEVGPGMTARVYRTTDGLIVKELRDPTPRNKQLQWRDWWWLTRLVDCPAVPDAVAYDEVTGTLVLTDAGEPLTAENLPTDWEQQLRDILETLRLHNCQHNDLTADQLLVKDGRLMLVDFGFAGPIDKTVNGAAPAALQKQRTLLDEHIIEAVRLRYTDVYQAGEVQCFVLWDPAAEAEVTAAIAGRFTIIAQYHYAQHSINSLGRSREEVLTRFYHGRATLHGNKAKQDFIVYVVVDRAPRYEERANTYNGDVRVVNSNMFDLLQELRQGRTTFLHGSDNLQEARDNLAVLSLYGDGTPVSYWEDWRPAFSSMEELFATLNQTDGLSYVVLRNHDQLAAVAAGTGDIDLLVNDYFLCKRVTGARSYKHLLPPLHHRYGPAKEYGGYKVAARVMVGGLEVGIDIRSVGDEYFDQRWQTDVLRRRELINGVYVPQTADQFYTLLYHALAHKWSIPTKYTTALQTGYEAVVAASAPPLTNRTAWLACLDAYMTQQDYRYVRPEEVSIPYPLRQQIDRTHDKDEQQVRDWLRTGELARARQLLAQLRHERPLPVRYYSLQLRILVRLWVRQYRWTYARPIVALYTKTRTLFH